jgi:APA family basic amino acid/polyamine antiporter
MENKSFKPTLGLLDATMIVAGSMIGSGIFIVSADIASIGMADHRIHDHHGGFKLW